MAQAITLAAFRAFVKEQDPLLIVLAGNHVIEDSASFQACVNKTAERANQDKLVTFGIVGNSSETGYGYIKRGEAVGQAMLLRVL